MIMIYKQLELQGNNLNTDDLYLLIRIQVTLLFNDNHDFFTQLWF